MTVSYCMQVRNRIAHLKRTLPITLAHLEAGDEIVLIDYGSTDGVAEWAAETMSRSGVVGIVATLSEGPVDYFCSRAKNIAHLRGSGDVL